MITLTAEDYAAILQRIGEAMANERQHTLGRPSNPRVWAQITRERCDRDMATRGYTFLEGRQVRVPYDQEQAWEDTLGRLLIANAQKWGLSLNSTHEVLRQVGGAMIQRRRHRTA